MESGGVSTETLAAAAESEVSVETPMRTWEYCALGVLVGTAYVVSTLSLRRLTRPSSQKTVVSPEYRRFQRNYVTAFVLGLFCEYCQAAQTFALLRHARGEAYASIAAVYACGFGASWLTTFALLQTSAGIQRPRPRVVACFCAYGVAAAFASVESWGLRGVAASRVVAGCALPLLQSSFDAWMRAAHQTLGFPVAWRRSTYELAGAGTTFASILSGVVVEVTRRRYHERRPFEATAVLAVLGLAMVLVGWPRIAPEKAKDETTPTKGKDGERGGCASRCRRGITTVRSASRPAVAVSVAACLLEVASYVTNATWATTLARVHDRRSSSDDTPYYGFVFALLMASAVLGTHLFKIVSSAGGNVERLGLALCATACVAFATLAVSHNGRAALFPLLAFQLAVGCGVPTLASLRGKFVPADLRAPLANASNVAHGALVLGLVLLIPANTQLTFALLSALMLLAGLAIAFLFAVGRGPASKTTPQLQQQQGSVAAV